MGRPARIVLMRHAESKRNEAKKGRVYFADDEAREHLRGVPDHLVPITNLGWRQARETGLEVRRRYGVFDYIYHSGYLRNEQTLEGLLEAYTPKERARMRVRHNLFLRERDPGYTYEMTEAEAEAVFPWLQDYWKTHGGFFARPPGGESLADVVTRIYLVINMLMRDRAGQNILIVLHGGSKKCFCYLMERWNYEQALSWPSGRHPDNCAITVYENRSELDRMELVDSNLIFWR